MQVLKAIRTLTGSDVVRGQFGGYLKEPGVAISSTRETFAAVRFMIGTWRWQDVPFFVRAGKNMPVRATEVLVRFKRPPLAVFDGFMRDQANYLRFRISPMWRSISVPAARRRATRWWESRWN